MIDNKPTYTVRSEETNSALRYFAAFADGDRIRHEVEISHEVYLALEQCRRHEQRQRRSDERHQERFALSEGQLAERLARPPLLLEDDVVLAVDMQAAFATLTNTQRRRFLLYHEHGLSFEQIAEAESRSVPTILESITVATEKIKYFWEQP